MRRGEGKEEGRVRKGGGKREEMGFFCFFFPFPWVLGEREDKEG